jgi:hypothetical protein
MDICEFSLVQNAKVYSLCKDVVATKLIPERAHKIHELISFILDTAADNVHSEDEIQDDEERLE